MSGCVSVKRIRFLLDFVFRFCSFELLIVYSGPCGFLRHLEGFTFFLGERKLTSHCHSWWVTKEKKCSTLHGNCMTKKRRSSGSHAWRNGRGICQGLQGWCRICAGGMLQRNSNGSTDRLWWFFDVWRDDVGFSCLILWPPCVVHWNLPRCIRWDTEQQSEGLPIVRSLPKFCRLSGWDSTMALSPSEIHPEGGALEITITSFASSGLKSAHALSYTRRQ